MYEQNNNMQQQFQNLNQQGTGMNPNMQQPMGMSPNPSIMPVQQPMMYPNSNMQQQYSAPPQNTSGIDENAWFETEGLVTESGMVLDRSGNPVQGINDKGPWMKWMIKLQTNEGTKTMTLFRNSDPAGQWLPVPMTGNYIRVNYKCKENPKYSGDLKRAYKNLMKFELLNTQQPQGTGQQFSQNFLTNPTTQAVNQAPSPVPLPIIDPERVRTFVQNYVTHCQEKKRSLNEYELIGVYYKNKHSEDQLVKELIKAYGEICGRGY